MNIIKNLITAIKKRHKTEIKKEEKLCRDCKKVLKDGFKNRCPECWDDIYFPK